MQPTEERLSEVLRECAGPGPTRPDRYTEVRRRIRTGRRQRAMATGGGVASVTAVAVVAVALSTSPSGPASSGFASGGTPATSTGPTLPPPAYNQHQAIATLTGAGRGWTNGSHSVTVTAGGTLAVTTECYGVGTMSVTVADAPQPLTTQQCAAESSSRSMQISAIAPGEYSSFHIQPGAPVTITVTRSGGDSDQWRIYVLRDPDVAVAEPSPRAAAPGRASATTTLTPSPEPSRE